MASERHQIKMIAWTVIVITGLFVFMAQSMLEPPHLYRHRIAVAQARLRAIAAGQQVASRLPASIGTQLTSIQDSPAGQRASNKRQHRVDEGGFFPALAIETYDVVLPCLAERVGDPSKMEGSRAVVPSTVKQVRIRTSKCDASAMMSEMQITNQSNGFDATIFQPSKDTWLTDYISITKDSSVIRLAFSTGSKSSSKNPNRSTTQTRDFVIERAPASVSN